MRIRKNAKLSPLLSSEAQLQPHVCQLNQSPWDVLPLSSLHEFEGDDNSFTAVNGNLVDSAGLVESVVSSMNGDDMVVDDEKIEGQMGLDGRDEMLVYCNKTDGKRWHCKRLAKQGHSMCEHHLNQLKSYSYNKKNHDSSSSIVSGKRKSTAKKKLRACSTKGGLSTENPYQYYYYSGFGPKWGKNRSGIKDGRNIGKFRPGIEGTESESPSSSVKYDNEETDFLDDDDEEEDIQEGKKKKMRKPVKARSLKSLL